MKHIKKIYAVILVIAMASLLFAIPASAKSITDYQNSVVCIGSTVEFTSSNYDLSFTVSGTGTGFAVGKPGEDVQYLATCAHVVSEPSGIYSLYVETETGILVDYVQESEGTYHPSSFDVDVDGVNYTVICDYFTTNTVDLYALFSNSTNDYVSLTVAQINSEVDLALCKMASAPTDRLNALPLQLKGDVEVNTDVIAIGYPSTSRAFNAENRMDSTDSTVKDGIVSKLQRTNGMSGSQTTFDAFEVTAELTTGMSGGPVISEESGAVIGVTAFSYTDVSQAAGARYAICIDYLLEMLDRESVSYKIYGEGVSPLLIVGIFVAVLLIAGIIVVVIFMTKKPAQNQAVVGTDVTVKQEAPKKYYLLGVAGPLGGKKFGITNSAIIGRDKSKCNVLFPIDQPGVSGIHCEVKISGTVLTLMDCNSSYGTFLENGTKLTANVPVVLNSGAKFWVGSKENIFEVRY